MNGPNDINAQFGRLARWSSLRALRNYNRRKEVLVQTMKKKKTTFDQYLI